MKPNNFYVVPLVLLVLSAGAVELSAQSAATAGDNARSEPVLLTVEGRVEISRAGSRTWSAAQTNLVLELGDRVRTGLRSRAVVRFSDLTMLRVDELTTYVVQPPSAPGRRARLDVQSGTAYFFSRERPGEVEFSTPLSSGAIRGTEFQIFVADNGRSVVTLIDGALAISNSLGAVELMSGEEARVEPGGPPEKSPVINAINIIQWCLYYPGVLDVDELGLTAGEQQNLAGSLGAYRSGDLLGALANYPAGRMPQSDAEKIYFAALLLAAGQVNQSENQLGALPAGSPFANALREVVAAVKFETWTNSAPVKTATGWLAESYYLQSRSRLEEALKAARTAVDQSPQFGFGWERVAELEFSFGRVPAAEAALDRALAISPRNAEAVALKGFLSAARNNYAAARRQFDEAIALDGALDNAWLGRGLVRIHVGDADGGRQDLQVAATLGPQRAVLRSYLGKAFSNEHDNRRAETSLARARSLDPNDPTAWLYTALLDQQENRINDAISDLQRSQDLNDNRSVFRSRLLLDQDRAVRGANLASIYLDDGMNDVSVQEAVKAVNADYANFSAHLFLANSYYDLRDPSQINLRYETPYVSEYLLANLLAPVGAGTLSQQVSQQEYSRMFDRQGVGLSSDTQYTSHGDWRQNASEYGNYGDTSFSFEQFYQSIDLYRPNSDMTGTEYNIRFKQQLTLQDSVYVQTTFANSSGGNLIQYYDQSTATNSPFRYEDKQNPILVAGYHHEWSPGMHSLVLFSWLNDTYSLTNPTQASFITIRDTPGGPVEGAQQFSTGQNYNSTLEIYSVEGQQIWQAHEWTTVAGARFQGGTFDTGNYQETSAGNGFGLLSGTIADQNVNTDFQRENIYGYEQWQPWDSLLLVGGLAYDRQVLPENFRYAPVSAATQTKYHLLPKGGLIWMPGTNTTLRAAYSQSVGGASIDQSFQLEPTQVAGFNQAFRSLIPEAVAGANAGATFTVYGASLEEKFPTRTYLTIEGGVLQSSVSRQDGAFEFDISDPTFQSTVGTLKEDLDYTEGTVTLSAHQLVDRDWVLGSAYTVSRVWLDDNFPEIPGSVASTANFPAHSSVSATLQTVVLQAIYQNPQGFFGRVNGIWTRQDNDGYATPMPGDNFWQCNVFAGYRFFHRQAEITVGILNLTGADYHLNPLNLYPETPRERVFYAELKFQL